MNFTCRCGYRFHDNTDELRFKARILPDQDFNEFYTLLEDAGKSHTKEEQHHIFDKIYDLLKKMHLSMSRMRQAVSEKQRRRADHVHTERQRRTE